MPDAAPRVRRRAASLTPRRGPEPRAGCGGRAVRAVGV